MNQMELSFNARIENEPFARTSVASFITSLNPTIDELVEIKTIISEGVSNAIIHGYGGGKGTVRLHATYTSAGMMTIDVIDRGCGIRDIEHARQPFFTTSEGEERSGMGFTVMESFMDVVEVRSVVGHGTTVRLIKQIDVREEPLARHA